MGTTPSKPTKTVDWTDALIPKGKHFSCVIDNEMIIKDIEKSLTFSWAKPFNKYFPVYELAVNSNVNGELISNFVFELEESNYLKIVFHAIKYENSLVEAAHIIFGSILAINNYQTSCPNADEVLHKAIVSSIRFIGEEEDLIILK